MNRRDTAFGLIALSAVPHRGYAQKNQRVWRIGVLRAAPDDAVFRQNFAPFLPTLRDSGFTEGTNLTIDFRVRPGNAEELQALANEIVLAKADAILAIAAPGVTAASKATRSTPIVAVDLESDPIASGFATSLSHPGGNITGLFLDFPELSGKWIQLLKEALPELTRAAVLYDPAVGPYLRRGAEAAGASMQVELTQLEARSPADFAHAFELATTHKAQAILALSSPVFASARKEIAALAVKHRLPAIMPFPQFADDGGLLAYGPQLTTMFRQAAEVMVKVMRGGQPRDIPIERPTRFELVVNLSTARTLGINIPRSLLLRADRTIE